MDATTTTQQHATYHPRVKDDVLVRGRGRYAAAAQDAGELVAVEYKELTPVIDAREGPSQRVRAKRAAR